MRVMSALIFCGLLGCAAVEAGEPKIKAGDSLELSLMKMPKSEMDLWNRTYKVNGAGEIALPLLGKIKVSGMTLEEATSGIEKALRDGQIYRNPYLDLQFLKAAPKAAPKAPKENKR